MNARTEFLKKIRFGIIGLGLMGKEFASIAARWCHLPEMDAAPEIVAVCAKDPPAVKWFSDCFPSIRQATDDYTQLLGNPDIDAIYCAVPHHLHEEIYCAAMESGKHLMGEKPFGIDKRANDAIMATAAKYPHILVRCSSEFPFFPAVQRIGAMIERNAFGEIIEVECGFLHSSDLDRNKPINWKRMIEYNGEYGSMGDLGMHVCHVPFRAGWIPKNVCAVLNNIVKERPDGKGGIVPCETWDNATLLCQGVDLKSGDAFPMTFKTFRIAPGEKNTWYVSILGTKTSVRFSTKNPKLLQVLEYSGKEQTWQHIDMGHETAFKSITGGIFEFGFSDALLQMWAAFLYELHKGKPMKKFAFCVTPEETALSHKLFTAALESHKQKTVVSIE